MIVYNGKLYGASYSGGANNAGVLFEFNPANNALIKKHDFATATGSGLQGDLVVFNNKLYGITGFGGGSRTDGICPLAARKRFPSVVYGACA